MRHFVTQTSFLPSLAVKTLPIGQLGNINGLAKTGFLPIETVFAYWDLPLPTLRQFTLNPGMSIARTLDVWPGVTLSPSPRAVAMPAGKCAAADCATGQCGQSPNRGQRQWQVFKT